MKMIKNNFKAFFCLCFFSLLSLTSFCFAEEAVDSFYSQIVVNEDSSLDIKERIVYDFDYSQKHGIYRDIKLNGSDYNLVISNISVTDDEGSPLNFETHKSGDVMDIKIGSKTSFISGKRTYVISYKLQNAIKYFEDYDELYLNINGFDWKVPIKEMGAEIIIPKNLENDPLFFDAYCGSQGSEKKSNSIATFTEDNTNIKFNLVSLNSGENLTVLARFPKGIVEDGAFTRDIISIIGNWIFIVPILVFITMFFLWFTYGRKPKGRGTIIPQYDVINNLTPVEVGTLIDEKTDNVDVSAEIIYLATKGYLTITQVQKKALIGHQTDYVFKKLKSADETLGNFDKAVLDFIFKTKDEINLTELSGSGMLSLFSLIKKDVSSKFVQKGYFKSTSRITTSIILLILVFFIFSQLSLYFNIDILVLFCVGLSFFIIIFFLGRFSKTTKVGAEVNEHIQGFKLYLSVAEKDRINFHNAPEKNPQVFDKFLPYAMVLGVEKEWAKQFESMYITSDWYMSSDGMHTTSSVLLISSLHNFSRSTNTYFTSSSSQGFSSSGFSGGGFSGGGGGSW